MKSILTTVNSKDCALIAKGKKTILVRKRCPKLKPPFKCYIYAASGGYKDSRKQIPRNPLFVIYTPGESITIGRYVEPKKLTISQWHLCNCKIIGEFICDTIFDIRPYCDLPGFVSQYECGWKYDEADMCLTFEELKAYLGNENGFGWHISDFKIYNEPKELNQFEYCCPDAGCYIPNCVNCKFSSNTECNRRVTHPPQSWCYVEEIQE